MSLGDCQPSRDAGPEKAFCQQLTLKTGAILRYTSHFNCLVAQSCSTLCNPMDYKPPGSSVHGILQARILEWVAISFSRGSSQPRMKFSSPALAGEFFTTEPAGKPTSHLGSFTNFKRSSHICGHLDPLRL